MIYRELRRSTVIARDQEDRCSRLLLLYFRGQFRAAHAGHMQVRDDEIEMLFLKALERLRAIGGEMRTQTTMPEQTVEEFSDQRLIINHEYILCSHGKSLMLFPDLVGPSIVLETRA